jgi:hypothetical protein
VSGLPTQLQHLFSVLQAKVLRLAHNCLQEKLKRTHQLNQMKSQNLVLLESHLMSTIKQPQVYSAVLQVKEKKIYLCHQALYNSQEVYSVKNHNLLPIKMR